jgi:arylsulfatase A-like enzyme
VHSPMQAPPDQRGDGSPAAQYVGVLTELDRQLGRAFDHIRNDAKLRDNTIILVCSDNGQEPGLGSSGGLRGSKGQLYEGGIRSPLIVWSPTRVAAKGETNAKTVLAGIDFAPSMLAIAGIAPPPAPPDGKFDGRDMSDAFLGRSQPPREQPVMWVRPPDRPGPKNNLPDLAIREGKWKLLVDRDGSQPELFDIVADAKESKNLAKEKPEIAHRLSDRVIAWDKDTSK